jgi:sialic acid synthase SpsE
LVEQIKLYEQMLGDGNLKMEESEKATAIFRRKS